MAESGEEFEKSDAVSCAAAESAHEACSHQELNEATNIQRKISLKWCLVVYPAHRESHLNGKRIFHTIVY